MATHSRLTGWRWTAFLLGSLWVAIGCNPATLTGILMPFSDDRVPPVCPLAKKKEVTVCVVTNFAGLETRLETAPAANELAELFALQLRKRAEENREKIKVLAPSKTRNYAGAADFTGRTLQDIGKQCKADYVVSLEIASMDVYERKSSQMLYRGNTDINILVVDVRISAERSARRRRHGRAAVPPAVPRRRGRRPGPHIHGVPERTTQCDRLTTVFSTFHPSRDRQGVVSVTPLANARGSDAHYRRALLCNSQ